ncbi:MAG: GTPase Era [Desulfobulbaceae bacterium]|nr:GTPase Era [Desulfobulbaceae bacterium]
MSQTYRSGVAAICGPPNAGKSTLLNQLLQQKIAIVSPKPQTTRNRIMGVVHGEDYQIIVLDTPGLHEAKEEMNRRMVRAALEALAEADVAVFLADASDPGLQKAGRFEQQLVFLDNAPCPVLLALNKIDLLPRPQLLPLIDWCRHQYPFAAIVPLSALHGEGMDRLLDELVARLPEGPQYYPDDMPTDVSERFLVAEIVRESIFMRTREEVPYSTAVLIDLFDESVAPLRIVATILVERNSQKGIVIGKGGTMLAQIRKQATAEISKVLGRPVRLELWVKVQKNWTEKKDLLQALGLPE